MKKIFTLAAFAVAAGILPTQAADSYEYSLIGLKQQDGFYESYEYDEQNRLVSILQKEPGFDLVRFDYIYDEVSGNLLRMDALQYYSNSVWFLYGYNQYHWNDAGQLTEQNIVNVDIHGDESPSQNRFYTYNEDGTLAEMTSYYGWIEGLEYDKVVYTYNDKQQRVKIEQWNREWPTEAEPLAQYSYSDYEYDANGHVTLMDTYKYDWTLKEWVASTKYEYNYDADQNLSLVTFYFQGEKTGEYVYSYFTQVENDQVLFPSYPGQNLDYDDWRAFDIFLPFGIGKNPVSRRMHRRADMDTGKWGDYMLTAYRYDPDLEASIETVGAEKKELPSVVLVGSFMTIRGIEPGEHVAIYDTAGRMRKEFNYQGTTNMDLAPGAYILKTGKGSVMFGF